MAHSSLASGFLSGKWRPNQPAPEGSSRAARVKDFLANPNAVGALDRLDKVSEKHGVTVAQVSLAWVMAQPGMTAAIASATNPGQVKDLVGAVDVKLDRDDLSLLDGKA
jgi:aryl-alcohol dehydrogenase-like predicted oxidoreductase